MKRVRRIVSFILTLVMAFSSVSFTSVAYAGEYVGTTTPPSPHHTTGEGITYTTDEYSTGYKMTLVFLPIEGMDGVETEDELDQKVKDAWNEATPKDAIQVGKTIYFTSDTDDLNIKGSIGYGFPLGGFTYGLGNKINTDVSRARADNNRPNITPIPANQIVTPANVNSAMASLNLPSLCEDGSSEKYLANSMNMDLTIPVNMGTKANNKDLMYYFMRNLSTAEKEADEGITGKAYATANFAGLINYLATNGGTNKADFIYFSRIKENDAASQLHKYDESIPDNANCFEQGRYKGQNGEYRLIVEPYWNIKIPGITGGGKSAALTLRDIDYLYREFNQGIGNDQRHYYADLGYTTRLDRDDIWGLRASEVEDWKGKSPGYVTNNVVSYFGGGLAFFTSSMMQMTVGSPGYIGSITNVFLPGALTDDNQNISVASMEYIGDKEKPEDVEPFMQQVASMIAGAASGIDFSADSNILDHNIAITRDAILNGTIKLPGINIDDIDNEASQEELIDQLDSLIDEYETTETGESAVGAAIKDMLRNELGIDVDNPSTSSVNMQDFNLAVYVLARYGMTGLDALNSKGEPLVANTDIDGDGMLENAGINTPINRVRQALTLAAMMDNDKTKETLKPSDGSKWNGPFTITADDINAALDNNNKFSAHVFDDAKYAQSQGYEDSSEGAEHTVK